MPIVRDRSDTRAAIQTPDGTLPITLILGIGRNYADHAGEQNADVPDRPMVFVKYPGSVALDKEPIILPRACQDREQVDYEGELAVIIGADTRDATQQDADDPATGIVLGYCCANDVSARWWQKTGSGGQFSRGKSFDTFCPLGPAVVPAADVHKLGGPNALRITTTITDEHNHTHTPQNATTDQMIFPVASLIAELSRGTTLPAGTVILTGTPAGVGMARTPPRFLAQGDTVAVAIGTEDRPNALGVLTNPVRNAN